MSELLKPEMLDEFHRVKQDKPINNRCCECGLKINDGEFHNFIITASNGTFVCTVGSSCMWKVRHHN